MPMPSVPRPAFDLIIGGLWCASAVKVLGYTWQAYSQTWSTMPTASAGSASQSPSTVATGVASDILKNGIEAIGKAEEQATKSAVTPAKGTGQANATGVKAAAINAFKALMHATDPLLP